MKLNLDIYLSGHVQKLLKIKPAKLQKESEVTLHQEWWSLWRCEHLASDGEDKHIFVFTNAVSYFTILVFQQGLSIEELLMQFNKQLLHMLKQIDPSLPAEAEVHIRPIKGNPRSLVSVMNNIIYYAEMKLFEQKKGYDQTELEINTTPWGKPNYKFPADEIKRLLSELPIGE